MTGRRRVLSGLVILALGPCLLAAGLEAGGQETPKAPVEQAAVTAPAKDTPAAPPRPPRERMAVYVLLAWVWLSIAVLLGLLRLRVREADRVFRMGLDHAAGNARKDVGP